jgi:hypothetical protein
MELGSSLVKMMVMMLLSHQKPLKDVGIGMMDSNMKRHSDNVCDSIHYGEENHQYTSFLVVHFLH